MPDPPLFSVLLCNRRFSHSNYDVSDQRMYFWSKVFIIYRLDRLFSNACRVHISFPSISFAVLLYRIWPLFPTGPSSSAACASNYIYKKGTRRDEECRTIAINVTWTTHHHHDLISMSTSWSLMVQIFELELVCIHTSQTAKNEDWVSTSSWPGSVMVLSETSDVMWVLERENVPEM